jgi:replicative DNA helicase
VRSPSRRGQENRQVEVSEISAGIKSLAKELKVPVVVLAPLNRNPDTRAGDTKGRPKLSDPRESGSIEQDADMAALLWRAADCQRDEED